MRAIAAASIFIMFGETYNVMTVALPRSASNKSPTMKDTRFATSASLAIRQAQLDQVWIDLDPDAPRAVLLRRDDRDAPVAGSQIVNDIVGGDRRQPQHRIRDVVARRREMDVWCAGR